MGKAGTGARTFSTGCQSLSSPICFNLRKIILASGLSYIKYRIRRMVPKRHVVSADMGCPFHGEIRRRNLRASLSVVRYTILSEVGRELIRRPREILH